MSVEEHELKMDLQKELNKELTVSLEEEKRTNRILANTLEIYKERMEDYGSLEARDKEQEELLEMEQKRN